MINFFKFIESLLFDGRSIWVDWLAAKEWLLKVLLHLRWLLVLHLLLVHGHASRLDATLKTRLLVELLLLMWHHRGLTLVYKHCRHRLVVIVALVTSQVISRDIVHAGMDSIDDPEHEFSNEEPHHDPEANIHGLHLT